MIWSILFSKVINLTSLNCYSYDDLPSGKQGIIRQDGTFISFADISSKSFSQNSIKSYIEENYMTDIIEIIREKNSPLYQFRKDIYNYKEILVEKCLRKSRDNFSFYLLPVESVVKTESLKQNFLSFLYSFM